MYFESIAPCSIDLHKKRAPNTRLKINSAGLQRTIPVLPSLRDSKATILPPARRCRSSENARFRLGESADFSMTAKIHAEPMGSMRLSSCSILSNRAVETASAMSLIMLNSNFLDVFDDP